jgi:hypothetical protein
VSGPILITDDPTFVPVGTYQLIARSVDVGHEAGKQTEQTHEI